MVGPDNHQTCKLAVSACAWFQREVGHAGNGSQNFTQGAHCLFCSLSGRFGLKWVKVLESGTCSYLVVYLRIVFHGTRAQGITTVIHTEVVAAMVSIMSHYGELVTFGQVGLLFS